MIQKSIPLPVPNLKGREFEYITHTVEAEWMSTGGTYANDFERETAKYVNVSGTLSYQNGTSGLDIALLEREIVEENAVLVQTLTFIVVINPIKYIGVELITIDCNDSLCMDGKRLLEFCKTGIAL